MTSLPPRLYLKLQGISRRIRMATSALRPQLPLEPLLKDRVSVGNLKRDLQAVIMLTIMLRMLVLVERTIELPREGPRPSLIRITPRTAQDIMSQEQRLLG